ncbi:hypothetical protein ACFW9D_37505, partial [Streptomyces sp. NPDC059524]|uniref:hypothetical protein n=1 Tax=Streptomyces sp. NPDC059524 TaxID=3346856 RepID=UPI0036835371
MTSQTVMDEHGRSFTAAVRALSRLRGHRITDLVTAEPCLESAEAALRLGYPKVTRRAVTAY